jgi:hypothetical protein
METLSGNCKPEISNSDDYREIAFLLNDTNGLNSLDLYNYSNDDFYSTAQEEKFSPNFSPSQARWKKHINDHTKEEWTNKCKDFVEKQNSFYHEKYFLKQDTKPPLNVKNIDDIFYKRSKEFDKLLEHSNIFEENKKFIKNQETYQSIKKHIYECIYKDTFINLNISR